MYKAVFLILFTLFGCAYDYQYYKPDQNFLSDRQPTFRHYEIRDSVAPHFFQTKKQRHFENDPFERFIIRYPSVGLVGAEGLVNVAEYYKSKIPGKKKLVIILGIYGATSFPADTLAHNLTYRKNSKDTNVIILRGGPKDHFLFAEAGASQTEKELLESLTEVTQNTTHLVNDLRSLLDWAERQPEIDMERIAVVGLSVSSTVAALTAMADKRISTLVLLGGVSDFQKTLTDCTMDICLSRSFMLQRLQWTPEMLKEKISSIVEKISPITHASFFNPQKMLIIDAARDQYIPLESSNVFWNAVGKPERIIFDCGHQQLLRQLSILGFWKPSDLIIDFLERKL